MFFRVNESCVLEFRSFFFFWMFVMLLVIHKLLYAIHFSISKFYYKLHVCVCIVLSFIKADKNWSCSTVLHADLIHMVLSTGKSTHWQLYIQFNLPLVLLCSLTNKRIVVIKFIQLHFITVRASENSAHFSDLLSLFVYMFLLCCAGWHFGLLSVCDVHNVGFDDDRCVISVKLNWFICFRLVGVDHFIIYLYHNSSNDNIFI